MQKQEKQTEQNNLLMKVTIGMANKQTKNSFNVISHDGKAH